MEPSNSSRLPIKNKCVLSLYRTLLRCSPRNPIAPTLRLIISTFVIAFAGSTIHLQANETIVVALEGRHAPGLAPDECIVFWDTARGINNQGQVAFSGSIFKKGNPTLGIAANRAIWTGQPNNLALLVRSGSPAPGFENAVIDDLLGSSTGGRFSFNDQGEIAFLASVTGPGIADGQKALFAGTPGKLRLIAKDGDPAVGIEEANSQIKFEFHPAFGLSSHTRRAIGPNGEIAWTAAIVGPHVAPPLTHGVWQSKGGSIQLLSKESGVPISGHLTNLSITPLGEIIFINANPFADQIASRFYRWDGTALIRTLSNGQMIGEEGLTITDFGRLYGSRDGRIQLSISTRRDDEDPARQSLWTWKQGILQPIHISPTVVVPDLLESVSPSLISDPASGFVAYRTCSKNPESLRASCTRVLHLHSESQSRIIAYPGMAFPGGPEGATILFDGVKGLLERAVIANENGLIISHLGMQHPDGTTTQAIYQIGEDAYLPLISQGDSISIEPEKTSTTTLFTVHANSSTDAGLRSLNDRNELLLDVHTSESPKALVVLRIKDRPDLTIDRKEDGIEIHWTGDGVLEESPDILGPWTPVTNQAPLQTISTTRPSRFYRVTR